ncbi:alanine racemase [Bacillus sp. 03113]|uniref:alanine racemase n=1 Tax=Bacillus sp. 03113 TaxID=2578211 RepID=UPI0015E8E82D|nr:alanine racemase [Bacillus sp. 03113]
MGNDLGYYRDTWAEINLDHITYNVTEMKKRLAPSVQLMAVVKANAYGHGDVQVARTAIKAGATYLAVAFLDEAISLRKKGIKKPILVLGASRPNDIQTASDYDITLTVFQEEWVRNAKVYLSAASQIKMHLKLDTGMGRIGIKTADELKGIEQVILQDNRFILEGIFTHFATADEQDASYFNEQLQRFNNLITHLKKLPKIVHVSNSAASLRFPQAQFNAVRFGISMYGLTPSLEIESELPFQLKEAFSLHTKIVHVKKLKKGEKVSYGATYEAKQEEWIATLPIGYADGWIRKLSGQEVLLNGIRIPIVGRICMDQCMIKLPQFVEVGTMVTLIGTQGSDKISVNEIAKQLDTINYEVVCMISNRVPRLYNESGKKVFAHNSLLK